MKAILLICFSFLMQVASAQNFENPKNYVERAFEALNTRPGGISERLAQEMYLDPQKDRVLQTVEETEYHSGYVYLPFKPLFISTKVVKVGVHYSGSEWEHSPVFSSTTTANYSPLCSIFMLLGGFATAVFSLRMLGLSAWPYVIIGTVSTFAEIIAVVTLLYGYNLNTKLGISLSTWLIEAFIFGYIVLKLFFKRSKRDGLKAA